MCLSLDSPQGRAWEKIQIHIVYLGRNPQGEEHSSLETRRGKQVKSDLVGGLPLWATVPQCSWVPSVILHFIPQNCPTKEHLSTNSDPSLFGACFWDFSWLPLLPACMMHRQGAVLWPEIIFWWENPDAWGRKSSVRLGTCPPKLQWPSERAEGWTQGSLNGVCCHTRQISSPNTQLLPQ